MIKKLFISALAMLLFNFSFGQIKIDYEDPREYEIAGIQVSGINYLDNTALIQVSGLSVGKKILVPGDDITTAVKTGKMPKDMPYERPLERKGNRI